MISRYMCLPNAWTAPTRLSMHNGEEKLISIMSLNKQTYTHASKSLFVRLGASTLTAFDDTPVVTGDSRERTGHLATRHF
jgi:hypothetical protein